MSTQSAKDDPMGMWPTVTHGLTIGSADIDISTIFTVAGMCHRIYCQAAGTVSVQRTGDSGFTAYTVLAGTYLSGKFTHIAGTSNGTPSTAIGIVLELVSN